MNTIVNIINWLFGFDDNQDEIDRIIDEQLEKHKLK